MKSRSIKSQAAKYAFLFVSLAIFGWTASLTYTFVGNALPNLPWYVPLLSLVVFDVGMLAWCFIFLFNAEGSTQRTIAAGTCVIDLVGVGLMVFAEILLGGQSWAEAPENLGEYAIWAIAGWTFINLAAVIFYHLGSPEAQQAMAVQSVKDAILDAALAELENRRVADGGRLADALSASWFNEMRSSFGSNAGGAPASLPSPNGATKISRVDQDGDAPPKALSRPAQPTAGSAPLPRDERALSPAALKLILDGFNDQLSGHAHQSTGEIKYRLNPGPMKDPISGIEEWNLTRELAVRDRILELDGCSDSELGHTVREGDFVDQIAAYRLLKARLETGQVSTGYTGRAPSGNGRGIAPKVSSRSRPASSPVAPTPAVQPTQQWSSVWDDGDGPDVDEQGNILPYNKHGFRQETDLEKAQRRLREAEEEEARQERERLWRAEQDRKHDEFMAEMERKRIAREEWWQKERESRVNNLRQLASQQPLSDDVTQATFQRGFHFGLGDKPPRQELVTEYMDELGNMPDGTLGRVLREGDKEQQYAAYHLLKAREATGNRRPAPPAQELPPTGSSGRAPGSGRADEGGQEEPGK